MYVVYAYKASTVSANIITMLTIVFILLSLVGEGFRPLGCYLSFS